MEGLTNKAIDACPQLLDLISKDTELALQKEEIHRGYESFEERKLELKLGPPGEEDWGFKNGRTKNNFKGTNESLLSLGYSHNMASLTHSQNNITPCGTKRGFADTSMMINNETQVWKCFFITFQVLYLIFLYLTLKVVCYGQGMSQLCSSKVVDLHSAEKKELSPASENTAVCNTSQKRNAPAAVVGWPPIRSFRKNLAGGSSSKPASETEKIRANKTRGEKTVESCRSSSFVKIHMEGIPIGRKVNLKAYGSYEKLSSAVDELFRDLLKAQRDPPADGIDIKQEEEKAILGSGEYALVYEINEGDWVLAGGVPWHKFVSTVRRLRVVKRSEISTLRFSRKQDKSALARCCQKNEE